MFAVVALIGFITYSVQQQAGALKSEAAYPLLIRIENAITSYAIYLWQTLVPVGLIPLYPHPKLEINHAIVFFSLAILLTITALAWWIRKSKPSITVGWLIFIGTLVPVIGLVQVGSQAHADRYMYFPMIGLSIMIFWPLHDWLLRKERLKEGTIALAVIMAVYAGLAWNQTSHWRDSGTLWQYTLKQSPDNGKAHEVIALDYLSKGNHEQGAAHLTKSLTIQHNKRVMDILGKTYRRMGRPRDAESVYAQLVERYPDVAVLWTRVAASIVEQGRADEATPFFQKSLELMGENIETHIEIGKMYLQLEQYAKAEREFRWVIEQRPQNTKALTSLGVTLLYLNQTQEAVEQLKTALDQAPDNFDAWLHLAIAHQTQNDIEASITACEKALQLKPKSIEAKQLLESLTTNE
jgi:tetratricopeptide (TPR) repeat protein